MPTELVVVCRVTPVPFCVIVTVALLTTAPVPSVTVPVRVPRLVWATIAVTSISSRNAPATSRLSDFKVYSRSIFLLQRQVGWLCQIAAWAGPRNRCPGAHSRSEERHPISSLKGRGATDSAQQPRAFATCLHYKAICVPSKRWYKHPNGCYKHTYLHDREDTISSFPDFRLRRVPIFGMVSFGRLVPRGLT